MKQAAAVVESTVREYQQNVKRFWLVKQEPSAYSWSDFVADKKTDWTGVRNYTARNNLRAMQKGDEAFYYHSVTEKAVVGVATVTRTAFPDPTADEGDWSAVELKAGKALNRPVTLDEIKNQPRLKEMALLRCSRLSVQPVTPSEFEEILRLASK
ncbi:MAG: EVE domain-containing protein [Chthoniobacterales bacterium]